MIQERMEPLLALAVQDAVAYYLFYTEGWEERFFFFISDYFSAYRVILGNYCSSWGSGLGSDSWVLIPALPVDKREWEGPTIRTLARTQ